MHGTPVAETAESGQVEPRSLGVLGGFRLLVRGGVRHARVEGGQVHVHGLDVVGI